MSSKFSNKHLGIIFGVLLILAVIFLITENKNERTFRENLVSIDTSSVTEIKLYPKAEEYNEVKLFKDRDEWKVELTDDKIAIVPESKIKSLLNQLLSIKPKRLAARGESKWSSFEVDSTGTRVKVFEGSSEELDIIIGRFAFQQPRSMSTYVRLTNDTDVYEVDGFLSATFNQGADNFRDNTVIKGDHKKWSSLTFDYPADSSFQMIKLNNEWFVNDQPTDSAATVKYLRSLQRLTNTNFVEDLSGSMMLQPTYKLTITTEDMEEIVVNGFVQDSVYAINSSLNANSYFDGNKVGLGSKIFVGMKKLFEKSE